MVEWGKTFCEHRKNSYWNLLFIELLNCFLLICALIILSNIGYISSSSDCFNEYIVSIRGYIIFILLQKYHIKIYIKILYQAQYQWFHIFHPFNSHNYSENSHQKQHKISLWYVYCMSYLNNDMLLVLSCYPLWYG